jgi:hypothetical protein
MAMPWPTRIVLPMVPTCGGRCLCLAIFSPQKPMHPLHEIRYFLLNLIELRDYLGIHWAGYKAGHKAVVSLLPRFEELSEFRDHFHVLRGTRHAADLQAGPQWADKAWSTWPEDSLWPDRFARMRRESVGMRRLVREALDPLSLLWRSRG